MMTNTKTRYGGVARFFHWAVALLIVTGFVLGLVGKEIPRNADTIATLKALYSVHKTIGVSIFFLAVLRILWALSQPRPVPLHPDNRLETIAAEIVHWALYAALVIVPLSGWIMHAAEVGFASIWWPFGQGLPFVPKSDGVAHAAGAVHSTAVYVLLGAVVAHVAGALKHVIIDKDATLRRMTRGVDAGDPSIASHGKIAPVAAFALWAVVIGGALMFDAQKSELAVEPAQTTATETAVPSIAPLIAPEWTVTQGDLTFSVAQSGAPIEGVFGTWNAQIAYDVSMGMGTVLVSIDTTTLSLGSVTSTATGPDFFNTNAFTTSVFKADITRLAEGPIHEAIGTLTLIGQTVPVVLEFELETDGVTAKMTGSTTLDRRDFGMGQDYADESTVGFAVDVNVDLIAKLTE